MHQAVLCVANRLPDWPAELPPARVSATHFNPAAPPGSRWTATLLCLRTDSDGLRYGRERDLVTETADASQEVVEDTLFVAVIEVVAPEVAIR